MVTKIFLCFTLLFAATYEATAQENHVGIFLTTKFHKKCQHILFTRNRKIKVCTPEKPIVWSEEFASITEIKTHPASDIGYFRLILTQKGYDKIKSVIEQLPGTELVLVVDNSVVGFVKNKNEILNKSIQIDGPVNSVELKWVHESLQKTIPPKQ